MLTQRNARAAIALTLTLLLPATLRAALLAYEGFSYDEIRLSTSYADATIPEPAGTVLLLK